MQIAMHLSIIPKCLYLQELTLEHLNIQSTILQDFDVVRYNPTLHSLCVDWLSITKDDHEDLN